MAFYYSQKSYNEDVVYILCIKGNSCWQYIHVNRLVLNEEHFRGV